MLVGGEFAHVSLSGIAATHSVISSVVILFDSVNTFFFFDSHIIRQFGDRGTGFSCLSMNGYLISFTFALIIN